MTAMQRPRVLAFHREPGLTLFVVGEPSRADHPANGGLRIMRYDDDAAARDEAMMLAERMAVKHRLYRTGFRGVKLVARVADPEAQKGQVLDRVRDALTRLDGTVYTGCDLNVTEHDMAWLHRRCPYVLAALGVSTDASAATGHGVVGSIRACMARRTISSALVHGTGAVGHVVARRLASLGVRTYTTDLDPRRAAVDGCQPVDLAEWADTPVDLLVPCSTSGLLTAEVAKRVRSKLVVSATNGPVHDEQAMAVLRDRGVDVLPDPMSNAGAVIADSVEFFAPTAWERMTADEVYTFVENTIHRRTEAFLDAWHRCAVPPSLESLLHPAEAEPIGLEAAEMTEAVA